MESTPEINDLPIDLEEVSNVFHIADLHIRNFKRHDEYRQVFKQIYQQIDDRRDSNSIAVVVGDVVHSKADMSPELVDMVVDLLSNLGDRVPVILTPGNHDMMTNNPDRLDALSPIISAMDHDNVYYIFDTGLYRVGDVVFSHMNFLDDASEYISADEIPDNYTKVALYHDIVDRSETEYGYILENKDVTEHTFVGFDYVMLGDVHRRQQVVESRTEAMEVPENEVEDYLEAGWEIES